MNWLRPLQPWIEERVLTLSRPAGVGDERDYAQPLGEPALMAPDSVSWQVFRNPLSILVGGIAAVVLELAEPRVRAGVYEHSGFRQDPLARLQRTGRATMLTVYGARSKAEASIGRVRQLHGAVAGRLASGERYAATDPALLNWVHATASFGFLEARDVYVDAIAVHAQDSFYAEVRRSALLYGAQAPPASRADMQALLDAYRPVLEPSPLVFEFLGTMERMPLLPKLLAPVQRLLVRAAVQLLPDWTRDRLQLGREWDLPRGRMAALRSLARGLDRLVLPGSAPVQACRRLGLPDDYLLRRRRPTLRPHHRSP